ncbi:MAG: tRNA (adenosine(37)-N6)-threonylcarbamoyltransferase complex dimerization subunit type 1 TsaB [Rhodospirillales bacterium]|nr:tRNA (adenosine(37)-N6)-threonylcarbamoyltransferase complex dimerization subunit type 1 TsaB [Rhodospirillales bacterium]
MKILALDAATSACSAALMKDGKVIARRLEVMNRGQAEALMPLVMEVMSGNDFAGLDLLAVTTGPGAFTGLRIGLAAARGLAVASGLPCLGITTLEAVAEAVPATEREGKRVMVAIATKRADLYLQLFSHDLRPLGDPEVLPPQDLGAFMMRADRNGPSLLVTGDGAVDAIAALTEAGLEAAATTAPGYPDAACVAAIAARRWHPGDRIGHPLPLYLRPPEASVPQNGGRRRTQ